MIPLILVSKNSKHIDLYINSLIKKRNFTAHNIFRITPEKKEITIGQIRQIKKTIITFSDNPRLIIFYDFHHSTTEAQNAFLKSLEEKSENNQFILISENEYILLPTIRSRSNIVRLDKSDEKKLDTNLTLTDLLQKMEKNQDYSFLADNNIIGLDREGALGFIDQIIIYFRKNLKNRGSPSTRIIKKALKLKSLLDSNNLNPQLTLDSLLIFIKKEFTMEL